MAQTRLGARAALVICAAAATACGAAAPTSPSPVAPAAAVSPAGVWSGAFDITSCTGTPSSCSLSPVSFVLRLAQDGSGVVQIDSRIWETAPPIAVSVTSQTTAGTTSVSGSTATSGGAPVNALLEVHMDLSLLGATAAGNVRYTLTRNNAPVTKIGTILYAARDVTVYGAPFQGDWQGFVTRTCTGDCTSFDPVLPNNSVQLFIAQSGASVAARLASNEITGTVSGSAINATSHYAIPQSSCRQGWDSGTWCLIDITLTATADALDRLHGTITYRVEGVDDRGRPIAFSASATLDGVARWR